MSIFTPDYQVQTLECELAKIKLHCRKLQAELATLRAKAEAYEIGMERWCVFSEKGTPIRFFPDQYLWEQPDYTELKNKGYTCRKVKVCEVVE